MYFNFSIDNDIKEDNDYIIYVYVEDKDDQYCASNSINVEFEREKRNVVIDRFEIKDELLCGKNVDLQMKIQNLGTKEVDEVYILLENKELGISIKTEEFELEEFDEEDSVEKTLTISIPENVTAGKYSLKARVFFDEEENSYTYALDIPECTKTSVSPIKTEPLSIPSSFRQARYTLTYENQLMILCIILALGIIFIVFAILFFIRR